METDNQLIKYKSIPPHELETIKQIAPIMTKQFDSGLSVHKERTATTMLIAYSLGFNPLLAFNFIDNIQGKYSLKPKAMLALILKSGELEDLDINDESDSNGNPARCTVTMKRKGGLAYTASFSMQDALRAGLVRNNGGYDKYPANMLRWRAISFCASVIFPDVIGGMLTSEELGAEITPEGETIEGEFTEEVAPQVKSFAELASIYSPQEVLSATKELFDGVPPQTTQDLQKLATHLQGESND